jgi:biopolymer transport protein ExbB
MFSAAAARRDGGASRANGAPMQSRRCRSGVTSHALGIAMFAAMLCVVLIPEIGRAQQNPQPTQGGDALTLQPAAPAAPVTSDQTDTTVTPKLSFLHLLLKGGWFMVPIVICSLLGVAVIIEHLLVLRRSQILPGDFLPGLERVYRGAKDTEAGLRYCQSHPSPMARIMAAGIRKLPLGESEAEQAIADAGANEVAKLRRNLRTLHGISAVAPTLGLLGTVWGMIEAFQEASRVGLGHSSTLTTGIYEALVCTLAGLGIAIPVLMFYYFFVGRVDSIVIDLNDMIQGFLNRKADLSIEPPIAQPQGVAEPVVAAN